MRGALAIAFVTLGARELHAEVAPGARPPSAHGFDVFRIEQEDKITVPPEIAPDVWAFLERFLVSDKESLHALDPGFTSYWHEELFVDTYFDTPALVVYGKGGGVRHRRRWDLTDPTHRKSGRELVQIKLNGVSAKDTERGEIKFDVEYPKKVRRADDAHPLLGIVKADQREALVARLADAGVDARAMTPILDVEDVRRRIYVLKGGRPFLSVSFDTASSSDLWARWHVIEIEPELNEIPYTEADDATRQSMTRINERISAALRDRFPSLERDLTPKYEKAFAGLEGQIPFYRFLVSHDLDDAGGVLGLLVLAAAPLVFATFVIGAKARRRVAAVPAPRGSTPTVAGRSSAPGTP